MKIATPKTELQTALQKLSKATPTRSTLPILSCVLVEAEESGVVLRTTDIEITILVHLSASIEEVGSAAIPLQTLLNITNELPDTRLTITVDSQNRVELVTEQGTYDLMGKPAEEFPSLPEVDSRKAVGIPAQVMSEIIETTTFAVSRDELKPALTGVLFRFEADTLTVVSTDGHRLVRYIRKDYKSQEFTGDVIIPRKFLSLIAPFLASSEAADLWLGDSHMTATIGSDTFFTRIIDERFPDYESVIPVDNEKELVVDREALEAAVRRVSIFSNKSTHQIALHLSEGEAILTTEDPEKASKAREKIESTFTGEPLTIGYNALYLRDILSHLGTDSVVARLKTPISAALFYPQEQGQNTDLTMLLMPIRLND